MDISKDEQTMIIFTQGQYDAISVLEWPGGMVIPQQILPDPITNAARFVDSLAILRDIPPDDINPFKEPTIVGTLPEGFANGYEYFLALPQEVIGPEDWPDPV